MTEPEVDEAFDVLRFNVGRSIRYHDMLRASFQRLAKLTDVLSLVGGAGAVVALLYGVRDAETSSDAAVWLSGMAALAAAVAIVFGFYERYAVYSELKARFAELDGEVLAAPRTEAEYKRLCLKRAAIEKDEPPVCHALNVLAFNRTVDAMGGDKRPLTFAQQVVSFFY